MMSEPTPKRQSPKATDTQPRRETPGNRFDESPPEQSPGRGDPRGDTARGDNGREQTPSLAGITEFGTTNSLETAPLRNARVTVHTARPWQRETGKRIHAIRRLGESGGRLRLDPDENGGAAASLQDELKRMIAGQAEAIQEIVNIYQMHLAGLASSDRPVGALLLLGPTGTGKTRIVEAMAEALVGTPRAVLKIDCGEFQHSHEIAKLVGSPPGYLGHRETHPLLSQETLSQYHTDRVKLSFVLFDEIEKASDAVWNLLLGILDKATLTLGDNRRVDFSDSIIFLTSNLGAKEMSSIMSPGLGFGANHTPSRPECSEDVMNRIKRAATEAARRKFTPEFINRLDKMIVFHPLGEVELRKIVEIELSRLQDRILTNSSAGGFVLRVTDRVRERLLRDGVDARYGARHLRRAIETLIVQPLSSLVASGKIRQGDMVEIDDEGGERAVFCLIDQDLSMETMSESAGPSVAPMLRLAAALGDGGVSPMN
jgi:ATP-dependent Clp protease ATP-binding subunit ClpB